MKFDNTTLPRVLRIMKTKGRILIDKPVINQARNYRDSGGGRNETIEPKGLIAWNHGSPPSIHLTMLNIQTIDPKTLDLEDGSSTTEALMVTLTFRRKVKEPHRMEWSAKFIEVDNPRFRI